MQLILLLLIIIGAFMIHPGLGIIVVALMAVGIFKARR